MPIDFSRLGLTLVLLIACGVPTAGMAGDQTRLQWFGQSAFKIVSPGGKIILIDPFISHNPTTPEDHKDLKKLGNVDLILVTHGHGDHIGDTVEVAKMAGVKVALTADIGHTFHAAGWLPMDQTIRFNKSGPIQPLKGITVSMVQAEHSSTVVVKDEAAEHETIQNGGEPAGYIVELENGYTVYHAGDTSVFGDMALISALL